MTTLACHKLPNIQFLNCGICVHRYTTNVLKTLIHFSFRHRLSFVNNEYHTGWASIYCYKALPRPVKPSSGMWIHTTSSCSESHRSFQVGASQWFPCLHAEVTFGSTGFMKSYDRISSAFTPERLPVDGGRNTSTCIAYSSQSNHAHCAAVQAFVVDVSVIGSVGVFTLLVVPFLTSALHSSFISATLAVSWHDFHS